MKIPKAFGEPIKLSAFKHNTETPSQIHARQQLHADGEVARWWLELSDAGREEYVKEHPTSKYADYHRTSKQIQKRDEPAEKAPAAPSGMGDHKSHEGGEHENNEPKKSASPKDAAKDAHREALKKNKDLLKKAQEADTPEAWEEYHKSTDALDNATQHALSTLTRKEFDKYMSSDKGQKEMKPSSPARKQAYEFLKKKSSHIISHVKKDVKEWKHAGKALGKLAKGGQLDHEDKHAIGAVAADIATISVSLLLTGGAAHGVAAFMSHFGKHLAQEALLKAAIKGAIHHASLITSSSEEDQILEKALAYMMEQLQNGDLEALTKRFQEQEAKESKGKEFKTAPHATRASTAAPVKAGLNMDTDGAGAGICPEESCRKPMTTAMVGKFPSWVCANCRVSLPLPNDHEFFKNQEGAV